MAQPSSNTEDPSLRGTYWLTRIVWTRVLAALFLLAFTIALHQNEALIGAHGLTPVCRSPGLRSFNIVDNWNALRAQPTLFELRCDDLMLRGVAFAGAILSLFVLIRGAANVLIYATLYMLYLSIVNLGTTWYSFGWETQLLETGIWMAVAAPWLSLSRFPHGTPVSGTVPLFYRFLLFKIMVGAGMIKIRGDPCWRSFDAQGCMNWHYETQPNPHILSRWFHFTPVWFHAFELASNHFAELVAPWLLLLPWRKGRVAGGLIQIAFMSTIALSGNLAFLNHLTAAPAVWCLDDACWAWLFSKASVQQALDAEASKDCIASAGGIASALDWLASRFAGLAGPKRHSSRATWHHAVPLDEAAAAEADSTATPVVDTPVVDSATTTPQDQASSAKSSGRVTSAKRSGSSARLETGGSQPTSGSAESNIATDSIGGSASATMRRRKSYRDAVVSADVVNSAKKATGDSETLEEKQLTKDGGSSTGDAAGAEGSNADAASAVVNVDEWRPVSSFWVFARKRLRFAWASLAFLLIAWLNIPVIQNLVSDRQAMNRSFDPWHLANTYGAFGTVHSTRTEMIVQGTDAADPNDPSAVWREYEFVCKPGAVSRHPCTITPYHLRLDWLSWFAGSFGSYHQYPWTVNLVAKLLSPRVKQQLAIPNPSLNSSSPAMVNKGLTLAHRAWRVINRRLLDKVAARDIRQLMSFDPFHDSNLPRFVRIEKYEYHWTPIAVSKVVKRLIGEAKKQVADPDNWPKDGVQLQLDDASDVCAMLPDRWKWTGDSPAAKQRGKPGIRLRTLICSTASVHPSHDGRNCYLRLHPEGTYDHFEVGTWWSRRRVGEWLPPLSADNPSMRQFLGQLGWA